MQFGAKQCAQRARQGWTGHDGWAKPAGQRAQDLQGRLTVFEGHGYPLVNNNSNNKEALIKQRLRIETYSPITKTQGESTIQSETWTFSTLSPRISGS